MECYRPTSLDEALECLAAHPHATVLAGGTDLMVDVNLAHRRPDVVVSLRRVTALTEWSPRFIGATVTYRRMEQANLPALAQLARTVGSPQIRAVGTLGGNLGTASPAGDTLPLLAALDAHVLLASHTGRRRLRWDEFLTGPRRTALRPGELILGVEISDPPARQAYAKVGGHQAMTVALVSCGVSRADDGGIRVALGAVGPTVLRARDAEALASAEPSASPAVLDEFQRLVGKAVAPITDQRSTAEYRRHAAGVLARRTLLRCVER
jgi:CO/xanthine dehydrogenase FAD-binding subunit